MKDILLVKKAITHSGKFHTDDVLSTVLIKELNPNIVIERVDQYEADDSIEDILAYDIGLGEFDHHDECRELDDYGVPYSAFGKLWREFGMLYLEQYGFKNVELAYIKFNKQYVSRINQGDNEGYKNVESRLYENDMIVKFNPSWYECKNDLEISDKQFMKAVEFAKLIFSNWIREIYEEVELDQVEKNIWENALKNGENGIIVLEERIPWRNFLKKDRRVNVKLVITKDYRGGYSITSKDSKKIQVQDSEYLTFLHPSGFMGVASTLDNALKAAKFSLCSA